VRVQANWAIDVVGVAPNATLYCVNAFQPDPIYEVIATDESLIAGLESNNIRGAILRVTTPQTWLWLVPGKNSSIPQNSSFVAKKALD